jgi:hypothetical protein
MASDLPFGWGDRNNTMSEHDMKLGGDAANRFASGSSSNGAYGDGTDAAYKSSDEIKAFYMKQIDLKSSNSDADVPVGWEERQKLRQVEEKQYRAVAEAAPPAPATASSNKPEVALLEVATHTLNALAGTLEGQNVSLPMEERAAFAAAMKRAMDALAKCS